MLCEEEDNPSDHNAYTDAVNFERCLESDMEHPAYQVSSNPSPNQPHGLKTNGSEKQYRCSRRHGRCASREMRRNGQCGSVRPDANELALLRVSRKVSDEAVAILWATSFFSFELAHTLTSFVKILNPWQKGALRKLDLDITMASESDTWSWSSDDLVRTLASLLGTRDLHLDIRQSYRAEFRKQLEMLQDGSLPLWRYDLVCFRIPSLRHVTVIIEHGSRLEIPCPPLIMSSTLLNAIHHKCWTMVEKAQYVDTLRRKLFGL